MIYKKSRRALQKFHRKIINMHTSNITVAAKVTADHQFNRVKFKGIALKEDSVSFLHKEAVNLYISYQLDTWSKDLNADLSR